jgi:hypothetical protein
MIGFGAAAFLLLYLSVTSAYLSHLKDAAVFEKRLTDLLNKLLEISESTDSRNASNRALLDTIAQIEKDLEQPLNSILVTTFGDFVRSAHPSELFVAGIASIFVAYVVGELIVALGRILWIAPKTRPQVDLLGRIAKIDNPIIYREYESYASAFLILQGTQVLIILWVLSSLIPLFQTGDTTRFFLIFVCGFALTCAVVFASVQNRRYVEAILAAFDAPEKK